MHALSLMTTSGLMALSAAALAAGLAAVILQLVA